MTQKAVSVSIESKDGETEKSTSFEFAEVSELERFMIIQNIFNVMGVEDRFSDIIEEYKKIGKAYGEFFEEVNPIEKESTNILPLKYTDDKSSTIASKLSAELTKSSTAQKQRYSRFKLADAYKKAMNKEKDATSDSQQFGYDIEQDNRPEHYKTGILKTEQGNKYQCRLVCDCGHQQTLYIVPEKPTVICKQCNRTHGVRTAKSVYKVADKHNNFFIAGKFVGEDEMQRKNDN